MYLMRKQIDFSNLILKKTPNQYLCLPKGFNSLSKPHQFSSNYNVSAGVLQSVWYKIVIKQRSVKCIFNDKNSLKSEFTQLSRVFKFIDIISVEFIEKSHNLSSIAIYSRSVLGYYDFNVNRNRVICWLKTFNRELNY